jgi:ABC-2 type transport system ATP-binding protein
MIHVEKLVRRYGAVTAVNGISFDASPGEVVGLLGPNGAGKTTTLKILAGFLWPTEGLVEIAGRSVTEDSINCRKTIGYLPENNPLYEEMEVTEYLGWCASMRGLADAGKRQALKRVIDLSGLSQALGRDIGELSKGYRQRVGLAAAMVHDPPILLLDEPTSGLDPNQAVEMRELIAELRKEKTVLLCSHILSEVRASCGRVIIIHKGEIVAQGRPEALERSIVQEQKLHLTLKSKTSGLAGKIKEALSSLPGIASISLETGDREITLSIQLKPRAGDLREKILQIAAEKEWPVLELRREAMNLEDVFRSLTE